MSLAKDYKNQYQWRCWETVYDLLPELVDQTVLDLGCGVGDQTVDFIASGAKVIGVDINDDLLWEARSRCPDNNARFIKSDLRNLSGLSEQGDGIWSSFAAAYFIDLHPVLVSWKKYIKKGGWIALTEIDDLFGHEPLRESIAAVLEQYKQDAYSKRRYDFNMGRKLEGFLKKAGFSVKDTITLDDLEFSFSGPALKEVVAAWERRLDRMVLLHEFCGSRYENVKKEFLSCLTKQEHRSRCNVFCCIATC